MAKTENIHYQLRNRKEAFVCIPDKNKTDVVFLKDSLIICVTF